MQSEIAEVIVELKAMEGDAERRLAACLPDDDPKQTVPTQKRNEPGVKRCCAE